MTTAIPGRPWLWAALVLAASPGLSAQPVLFPQPLSPRIASYVIEARLDPADRTVSARETLTWHNRTPDPATELQFHLYPNAFRNTESTFLKESSEKTRKKLKGDGFGYGEVTGMKLAAGEDLTAALEFISPDDNNPSDRTVLRAPLPRPVPPGGSIELEIEFMTRLPEPAIARSGAKKDYFLVSQWFPKIGVFENGAWNCHQYHAHSEFYADFGVYDVRITVPDKYVVGATGSSVSRTQNPDGTATHYYHAEDVHDFAWTASPDFLEVRGETRGVEILVLLHKSHAGQGERHLTAARAAIESFDDWLGDYPYPNLTVVDPAPGAFATGGMEYPTLITAGTLPGLPRGVRMVEMVIIHEFGHNYFYHLIASNEFEESWLDEGVNTYAEIRIMHALYGAPGSLIDWPGLQVDDMKMRRASCLISPDFDPALRSSWEFYDGNSYRANSYSRPALALLTLENYLGPEKMQAGMRAYFERYRFKHPHTRDLVDTLSEAAGENLDWFFDQLLLTNAALDYSVDYVSSEKVEPGRGYDFTLESPGPERAAGQEPADLGIVQYETVVKVRRLGEFRFPVEVELEFEDGEVIRERWDGRDPWKEYRLASPARLKRARVDPDRKVVLDLDFGNNSRTLAQQKRAGKTKGGYLQQAEYALRPDR